MRAFQKGGARGGKEGVLLATKREAPRVCKP